MDALDAGTRVMVQLRKGYKLLDRPGESCMGLVMSEPLLYTCHDSLRPEVLTIPAL